MAYSLGDVATVQRLKARREELRAQKASTKATTSADVTVPVDTLSPAPSTDASAKGKSNMPLIVGGIVALGAAAAFFFLKRKKG